MDQLRKLFQKAVRIPLSNVEQIWKEYDSFENNLNKLTVGDFFLLFRQFAGTQLHLKQFNT